MSVLVATLAVAAPAGAATRSASSPGASSPGASSPGASAPSVQTVPASSADRAALAETYASARHLPGSAVAGIRPGSLRLDRDTATGVTWAMAGFTPASGIGVQARIGFQDGAATGVFSQAPGQGWRLAEPSGAPYACDQALPAAVRAAWHLAVPAGCGVTMTQQKAAASRALAQAAQPGSTSPLSQSIARIALSQVGVGANPPITNFGGVDCDPYSTLVAAQSPNSVGCGYDSKFRVQDQNEEWCSDFAKWVWQRAGVTADMNTINAGADSFDGWGLDQGETMPVDSTSPQVGDAVVFYPPGPVSPAAYADHVGIVTAVNPDGTVNLVNGDFLGTSNSAVQYDTDISLATWAPEQWSTGEQWIFVAPPTTAQAPVPQASITGPSVAVTGTAADFTARASEPGGSISQYEWTFGDGRTGNASGPAASHVYGSPGLYTVTMTAISNAGTVTMRTWNVDVTGPSSAVTSTPNDAVWYQPTPVDQDLYLRSASGGLADESWDGASWLYKTVPGTPSPAGGLTALNYADASGAPQPHVYYSSASGQLTQSYTSGGTWATQALAGDPAPGSAIVAAAAPAPPSTTAAAVTPEVFFIDTAGRPAETYQQGGTWASRTLPGPATSHPGLALTETVQGGRACVRLYYVDGQGALTTTSPGGCALAGPRSAGSLPGLSRLPVLPRNAISPSSPLAATATGPGAGTQQVFFTDPRGHLAVASPGRAGGPWSVRELPATPSGSLLAETYLSSSGQPGTEVFYLSKSGQPAVAYSTGSGSAWQSAALPGTGTALLGAAAFPMSSQPERLFLSGGSGSGSGSGAGGQGLTADTAAAPAGPWTASPLPDTAATFAGTVLLYGATAADYQAGLSAASAAGLPASQVTQSFATAWADTLSGDYLVIAVGQAALDALYFNACGWTNPSGEIPDSTPFYVTSSPRDTLPGADAFENGAAATAAQTPQRAADLAYYAAHGQLPPGVTALPAAASPQRVCSGQPS